MDKEVHEFVLHFVRASTTNDQSAQRKVRDMFQVEVAGFSEFIAVNGKIYRYGFISRDNARTCALARAMVDNDLDRFNDVVGMHLATWDALTAAKLKTHLRNNHRAIRALNEILPAPLVEVNDATRAWLRSLYENITRLNAEWNTEYLHWDDVVLTPDALNTLRRATCRDIEDIQDLLTHATKLTMTVASEDWIHDLFDQLGRAPPVVGLPHGRTEIVFATLASLHPACTDTFYVMLLMFLAVATRPVEALPPGVPSYTGVDTAAERAQFLDTYYEAATRSAHQEWVSVTGQGGHVPLRVLLNDVPTSSVKNFNHFISLVTDISK